MPSSTRRRARRSLLLLAFLPALLLPLLLAASNETRAENFLSAIDDLPLMPGLVELAGQGLIFDKPGGRIVELYAAGSVSASAVRTFYRDTLPQLGWQALDADAWRREGERLELSILDDSDTTLVRFTLRPE